MDNWILTLVTEAQIQNYKPAKSALAVSIIINQRMSKTLSSILVCFSSVLFGVQL